MDVAANPSALDTAADILKQIEQTHGIEILRDFYTDSILPAGAFRPTSQPLSYNNILELLRDGPRRRAARGATR